MTISTHSEVEQVMPVQKRYKLVSREAHKANSRIKLDNGVVIGGEEFVVMAGPCSVESETQLIANKIAYKDEWKRKKIDNISLMLNAAIAAQGRVGLMLNARKADLQKVIGVLPALNSPTVSQLSDAEWVALNTILDEALVREVIPKLKAAGATGIVEYPLSKVVL